MTLSELYQEMLTHPKHPIFRSHQRENLVAPILFRNTSIYLATHRLRPSDKNTNPL